MTIRSILIAIFLALFSGNALSDSAWVLWVNVETFWEPKESNWGKHDLSWEIIDAFTNDSDCKTKLKAEINNKTTKEETSNYDVMQKVEGNKVSLLYFPKNAKKTDTVQRAKYFNYICLPETVDPRKR